MRETKIITILNSVVLDSEADVEAVKALTQAEAEALADALAYGTAHIRTLFSTKVGTPAFTMTALQASIDGTNYNTLKTFDAAISGAAAGEMAFTPINGYAQVSDHRVRFLKLVMGGSAPDGSNKITGLVQLVLQLP